MAESFQFKVGDVLWVKEHKYWACYVSEVDPLFATVVYRYVYDDAGNKEDKEEDMDLQISKGSHRSRVKALNSLIPSLARRRLEDVRERDVDWFASTRGALLYCKENCKTLYSNLPEELKKNLHMKVMLGMWVETVEIQPRVLLWMKKAM